MRGHAVILGLAALISVVQPRAAAQERPPVTQRVPLRAPLTRIQQVPLRPNVVGRTYPEAESLLAELRVTVVRRDTLVPFGMPAIVLRQSPPAGTRVVRGAVDTLMVSRLRAARRVAVPDVLRAPYRAAVREIQRAGLAPIGPTLSPADSERARVVGQDPRAPGPALLGSAVTLVLTLDDRIAVPLVIGADTSMASRILARAGLRTAPFVLDFHDRFAGGVVFHQEPSPGDSVRRRTAVRLWVSRGSHPDTNLVLVPSVLRLTLDSARVALRVHRLAVGHVDTLQQSEGEGLVVSQDPQPGDTAHVGDELRLTLTVPWATAPVPRLLGLTRSRAQDTLEAVGLALGPVRIFTDPSGPDSLVVGQSVSPGTRLMLRGPVGIDVNLRPPAERVLVPRVVGLRLPEASDRLVGSRLTVGRVTERPSRKSDIVLDQAPKEGERVAPGRPVTLVVGRDTTTSPPPVVQESLVSIPAVVDTPLQRALAILDEAGFHHRLVDSQATSDTLAAWVVLTQAPQPGELVLAATLVQLQAGAIARVPVPNLVGLNESEAGAAATSGGFAFRVTSRPTALRLSRSRVSAQEPPALTLVAPGTPLDVTVSEPLPPIVTFGIIGASLAGAALAVRKSRPWKPRFRTFVDTHPPEISAAEETLIKTEATLRVQVEVQASEVEYGGDSLILREVRGHA